MGLKERGIERSKIEQWSSDLNENNNILSPAAISKNNRNELLESIRNKKIKNPNKPGKVNDKQESETKEGKKEDDEKYIKYDTMRRVGLQDGAIELQMRRDGLSDEE